MKLSEFLRLMEEIAPRRLAREDDNVGLLIGTDRAEINKVLVALDCTVAVAQEAVALNADLVLCHHPMFYHPVQRFMLDSSDTAAAYLLARNGIGMFAAHTNLDAAPGGVNDCLAELLNLTELKPLPPENLGRVGLLKTPAALHEFIARCGEIFRVTPRYCGRLEALVSRVAVVGGSGGSEAAAAKAAGADVLVTGEMKYAQAVETVTMGFAAVTLGHHETEAVVLKPLISRLQKAADGVQYIEATSGQAVLACFGKGC